MLVSGGKLLAIDKVNTDDFTVSGDGVERALSINTDIIATNASVESVSSTLYSDIQSVSSNFDNYYIKLETSGSEQLAKEFDSIKSSITNYNIVSLTPDNLYASVSADSQDKNVYVVSAKTAQDKLEFDGVYDPETNKVATVETVEKTIKTVKPIILEYNKTVDYTWEELQSVVPNVYVANNSALFDLAVVNENVLIFRQHTAARISSDEHSQIHVTELQLFRNLSWNTEAIMYTVSDPWSDNSTGISVSTGRISVNVDDSTIKINESNQLYVPDQFQYITLNVTKWSDIDFSKVFVLDASLLADSHASSSLYEMTSDHVTWLVLSNTEIYFVKLTDADVWSTVKFEIESEKYTAGTGLVLNQNEFSVDESIVATNEKVSEVSGKLAEDIDTISANFDNYYLKTETSGSDELSKAFDNITADITEVSSKLSNDISVVSANFDNYYDKTETSSSNQLTEKFDSLSSTIDETIETVSSNFSNYYTKSETSGSIQLDEEFDAIRKLVKPLPDIKSLTPDILYAAISADETSSYYVVSATNTVQGELEFDGVYDPETNKVATVDTVKSVKNVILTYNETPTQTYVELLDIVKNGKLYVLDETDIVQASIATEDKIEFTFVDAQQNLNYYSLSSDLTWSNKIDSVANDHKVSVAEGENPDYLQQVLVSDAEEVTLTKVDSQLRIGLNLTGESDPKLTTMNESQINDSTNNYGSWWGGDEPPTWNETGRSNVLQYRMKRTSDAQGSLTLCRCALTNNWGTDRPIFRIGIFDIDMTLLGSSDYFVYDKTAGQFIGHMFNDTITVTQDATTELDVPMHEETVGALRIARNTRYIIELITCGLSFAGKTQSGTGVTSNYAYDYTLENNLMISKSGELDWWTELTGKQQADKIPYLSFGASSIRSSSV